jgi:hypothetical protein
MLTYFLMIAVFVGVLFLIKGVIRNAASKAFEVEVVETDEFKLVKPEGFLTPVDRQFEAYSKDWSDGGNFRRAWINLHINDGLQKETETRSRRTEKDTEIETVKKKLANKESKKTFELEASFVTQYREEYQEKIQEMMESFTLK